MKPETDEKMKRVVEPKEKDEDVVFDQTLRPKKLDEYIGQERVKQNLRIAMEAAKKRKESIEHVLLHGSPGLGKCITPDSIIFTENGMLPIGTIGDCAQEGPHEMQTMIYGLRDAQTTSHFFNNGIGKTIHIRTHQGYELEGTPNHPVIVLERDGMKFKELRHLKANEVVAIGRGQEYFGKEIQLPPFIFKGERTHRRTWIPSIIPTPTIPRTTLVQLYSRQGKSAGGVAAQLQCSASTVYNLLHFYEIPVRTPYEQLYVQTTIPTEMSPSLARLCGYLIGDAYVGEMGEVAFTNNDKEILNDYQRIWLELFNQPVRITRWEKKCPAIRSKNKKIREFLMSIGIPYCTAVNKEIPWTILRAPQHCVAEFIRGYFECDGHIRPNCRQIDIMSASKKLIQQLQIVLLNFGIISRRYEDYSKKEERVYYRLYITGGDVDIFKQKIGFVSQRKQNAQSGFRAEKNTNKDLVPFGKERIKEIKRMFIALTEHLITQHADRTGKQKFSIDAMNRCLMKILDTLKSVEKKVEDAKTTCAQHIFWDRLEHIEEGSAQTVDVSIPTTHTFFANGFINHNTTLAHIIAHEMSANIRVTSGPAIERAGDLAAILTNLEAGDVLFIDEIHRLQRTIEEILYPAMEEFALDLVIGKGPAARTIRLDVPRFTLIGATTRVSLLSSPLRDRFGMMYHLNFYEPDDIERILIRSAKILRVAAAPEALQEIAKRSRRTPRIANRLLKRVRDYAQVKHDGTITAETAHDALKHLEVDEFGLDEIDRRILDIIITKFNGGPVGLNTIAAATSEEMATLEEVYEPFLMQIGFLDRTPKGRMTTRLAYEHLGRTRTQNQRITESKNHGSAEKQKQLFS